MLLAETVTSNGLWMRISRTTCMRLMTWVSLRHLALVRRMMSLQMSMERLAWVTVDIGRDRLTRMHMRCRSYLSLMNNVLQQSSGCRSSLPLPDNITKQAGRARIMVTESRR